MLVSDPEPKSYWIAMWQTEADRADRLADLLSSPRVFVHESLVEEVDRELARWRDDRY